ncbi:MAG: hypothetical protein AAFQ43_02615, partial [Bacteroidota bacterium]
MEHGIEAYHERADILYRTVRSIAYWVSVVGVVAAILFAVTLIVDHLLPSTHSRAVVTSHQCHELPYSRHRIGSDRVCDYTLRLDAMGGKRNDVLFRTDIFVPDGRYEGEVSVV